MYYFRGKNYVTMQFYQLTLVQTKVVLDLQKLGGYYIRNKQQFDPRSRNPIFRGRRESIISRRLAIAITCLVVTEELKSNQARLSQVMENSHQKLIVSYWLLMTYFRGYFLWINLFPRRHCIKLHRQRPKNRNDFAIFTLLNME